MLFRSPNESDFPEPAWDGIAPKVSTPISAIPNPTKDPYAVNKPSFKDKKTPPVWVAKKRSKII